MADFSFTVKVPAQSLDEAKKKMAAVAQLLPNLSAENLQVLAEKSATAGINEKIQMFKNLI
jgi:hypothetical protein